MHKGVVIASLCAYRHLARHGAIWSMSRVSALSGGRSGRVPVRETCQRVVVLCVNAVGGKISRDVGDLCFRKRQKQRRGNMNLAGRLK